MKQTKNLEGLSEVTGKRLFNDWNAARNTAKHHNIQESEVVVLNLRDEAYWMIRIGDVVGPPRRVGTKLKLEFSRSAFARAKMEPLNVSHNGSSAMDSNQLDIEQLRKDAAQLQGACSGVYFLFSEEELVYVGEGWNCLLRVAEHTRRDSNKTFLRWNFMPIDDEQERKTLERDLRRHHRPRYNKI